MKIAVPEGSENTSINTVGIPDCGCKSGIKLTHGCEGDAPDVAKQHHSGSVKSSDSCCHHHGGDHDHHHEPGHVCNH